MLAPLTLLVLNGLLLLALWRRDWGRLKPVSNPRTAQVVVRLNHDLRAPLTSIVGYSELLERQACGQLNDKQRRYVEQIRVGGIELLGLIRDLVDLSRFDTGQTELARDLFDPVRLFRTVFQDCDAQSSHRGVHLQLGGGEPVQAYGDQAVLRRALGRLVDNAIKFSEQGTCVRLGAWQEACGIVLEVADEGAGVPLEMQPALFELFESPAGRYRESQGLGLSLVRQAVRMHAGRIWVESSGQKGEGSRFRIWLPHRSPC